MEQHCVFRPLRSDVQTEDFEPKSMNTQWNKTFFKQDLIILPAVFKSWNFRVQILGWEGTLPYIQMFQAQKVFNFFPGWTQQSPSQIPTEWTILFRCRLVESIRSQFFDTCLDHKQPWNQITIHHLSNNWSINRWFTTGMYQWTIIIRWFTVGDLLLSILIGMYQLPLINVEKNDLGHKATLSQSHKKRSRNGGFFSRLQY